MSNRFTVATYNVGDFHPEHESLPDSEKRRRKPPLDGVCSVISALGTDFLLLQEVPDMGFLQDVAHRTGYSSVHFAEFGGVAGPTIAFLGRRPFGILDLPVEWPSEVSMGAAAVQISVAGRPVALCAVHLPPVEKTRDATGFVRVGPTELVRILYREAFTDTTRSIGAQAVLAALRELPVDGILVGGDFNTVFVSSTARRMRKDYRDSLAMRRGFFGKTYGKSRTLLPARVDYLFYRGDIYVVDSWIHKDTAGDHFPVVGVFEYSR